MDFILKGEKMRRSGTILFWENRRLLIEGTAALRVGVDQLRRIISEDADADLILWNGNRAQIKSRKFEEYTDRCTNFRIRY